MSLLGIDVGTTGCKAATFSIAGKQLAYAYREYPTLHPQSGWAELDSCQVWNDIQAVIGCVAKKPKKDPVTALCVSAMGEALTPIGSAGDIIGPCILSSDMRGEEYISELKKQLTPEAFYTINPNLPSPHFSLPKLLWLKEHNPQLYEETQYFMDWSGLTGYLLGSEAHMSYSEANRTLLFDMGKKDWSDTLLTLTNISREKLPPCRPAGSITGTVKHSMAERLGLPPGVQIVTGGHDQCLNAFGCGCVSPGSAVCGIGTYECLTPVYSKPEDPVALLDENLNMEDHVIPDLYVSFLFNQAGSLVRWFRDTFAANEYDASANIYDKLCDEIPDDPTRLLVLPHFEPSPWPKPLAHTAGAILGLKTSTRRGEILKAIMEGTTFHFVDGVEALRKTGIDTVEFVASGGGARSDKWLQIQADIFGVPFVRLHSHEGGLTGCAMLAGMSTKVFQNTEEVVDIFICRERIFEPNPARHSFYQQQRNTYRSLYTTIAPLYTIP